MSNLEEQSPPRPSNHSKPNEHPITTASDGETPTISAYSASMATSSAMESVAAAALRSVLNRVGLAAERANRLPDRVKVVAVSKTKPVSVLREVYDAGHRCFGENYVQELIDKAPQLPEDIEWHFIGNLQSNKVKPLLNGVPSLGMVESVDDEKIANHLDRAVGNLGRKPLKVLVQVNTSGEICTNRPYDQVPEYGVRVDFEIPVTTNCLRCQDRAKGGGMCGFETRSQDFMCLCEDRNVTSYCKDRPIEQHRGGHGAIAGTVTAVSVASGVGIGAGIMYLKKVRAKAPVTHGVQTNDNRAF